MYTKLVYMVGTKYGSISRGELQFCAILVCLLFGYESNHLQTHNSDLTFAHVVFF